LGLPPHPGAGVRWWYGHPMRVVISEEGLDAAAGQGVTRQQIRAVLTSPRRLVEDQDEETRAVTAMVDGTLITVWCVEWADDEWEMTIAFEAGLAVQLRWNHTYGEGNPDA
jgi:hypothetical protein